MGAGPERGGGASVGILSVGGSRFTGVTTSGGAPVRIETSEAEVVIGWGEPGSVRAGLGEALGGALTVALRAGVPVYPLVEELLNLRFVPWGETGDPLVPSAASVADHVARRLALRWLSAEERAELGVLGSPWGDGCERAPVG